MLLDTGTSAPSAVGVRTLQPAFLPSAKDRKWLDLPRSATILTGMWKLIIAYVLTATATASAAPAPSVGECDADSQDCVVGGKWTVSLALGAGVRSNPLVHGQDLPLVVVPQISYYGKRFYIDNLDVGFTAFDSGTNTLSLIASPGYDRIFFYRSDLQNIFVTLGGASPPTRAAITRPPCRSHRVLVKLPIWQVRSGPSISTTSLVNLTFSVK